MWFDLGRVTNPPSNLSNRLVGPWSRLAELWADEQADAGRFAADYRAEVLATYRQETGVSRR